MKEDVVGENIKNIEIEKIASLVEIRFGDGKFIVRMDSADAALLGAKLCQVAML